MVTIVYKHWISKYYKKSSIYKLLFRQTQRFIHNLRVSTVVNVYYDEEDYEVSKTKWTWHEVWLKPDNTVVYM